MIEGQEGVTWDDWVALAEACEEHGVETLFRSDHYLSGFDESRPVLDAWVTLSALAARTTRLRLGTPVPTWASSSAAVRTQTRPVPPRALQTSTTRSSPRWTSCASASGDWTQHARASIAIPRRCGIH